MDTPTAADTPSADEGPLPDADLERVVGGTNRRHVPAPPPTGASNGAVPRPAPTTPFFDDMMNGTNI